MKYNHWRRLTLFGSDISHSLSPQLHNSWLNKFKIEGSYNLTQVDNINNFNNLISQFCLQDDAWGANITHPYKSVCCEGVIGTPDPTARSVGCANTLYKNGDKWVLANTDIQGVRESLYLLLNTYGSAYGVVLLGTGGASRAVLHVLNEDKRCKLIVCIYRNKTHEQALNIASKIHYLNVNFFYHSNSLPSFMATEYPLLLINATPLGVNGGQNPWAQLFMEHPSLAIFGYWDLIYQNTLSFQYAKSLGIKALTGWIMLKTQAWESFKLWFPVVQNEALPHGEFDCSEVSPY